MEVWSYIVTPRMATVNLPTAMNTLMKMSEWYLHLRIETEPGRSETESSQVSESYLFNVHRTYSCHNLPDLHVQAVCYENAY